MGQISDDHKIFCVQNSRVEFGLQELWEPPEIIHKSVYMDTYVNFLGVITGLIALFPFDFPSSPPGFYLPPHSFPLHVTL